ncbi:MAG: hypothetical protein IJT75_03375 [Bacteroidaceae bacterium]|nr:hypothetical protein [Bacteroidaceae bacterium]
MLCVPSACRDDDGSATPRPGLPGDTLSTTFIFYIAGENSLSPYMAKDTLEMAQAMNQIPADARVVMFIDDALSTRLSVGTRETPLQCVRTFPTNLCATDSADMLAVLSDIVKTYPARHYALAMNSHASGWVFENAGTASVRRNSWGIDNGRRTTSNQGRRMNIPTLARVLEQLPHFDFILFDACFMQCIEVDYELRHVADYIIASPAEIPGDGAPYHILLPLLCQLPANDQRVRDIVQTYGDYYVSGEGAAAYGGVELSAVSTTGLEAFAEASRPIITQLFANRAEQDCSDVQRYNPWRRSTSYADFYDFGHLIYTLLPADYPAWHAALDQIMPARHVSTHWLSAFGSMGEIYTHFETIPDDILEHCSALSLFAPSSRYDGMGWITTYHQLEWYHASGLSETGW